MTRKKIDSELSRTKRRMRPSLGSSVMGEAGDREEDEAGEDHSDPDHEHRPHAGKGSPPARHHSRGLPGGFRSRTSTASITSTGGGPVVSRKSRSWSSPSAANADSTWSRYAAITTAPAGGRAPRWAGLAR